ncbi:hypothetical protein AAC387_Pa05g1729 [Persea americana]
MSSSAAVFWHVYSSSPKMMRKWSIPFTCSTFFEPNLLERVTTRNVPKKNKDGAISSFFGSGYWHYYFRPVMELKEAGIELSRSHRKGWSKIKFKQGLVYGRL